MSIYVDRLVSNCYAMTKSILKSARAALDNKTGIACRYRLGGLRGLWR